MKLGKQKIPTSRLAVFCSPGGQETTFYLRVALPDKIRYVGRILFSGFFFHTKDRNYQQNLYFFNKKVCEKYLKKCNICNTLIEVCLTYMV